MLQTKAGIKTIRQVLKQRYPHLKTPLRHQNPFELLVATILSGQCTDRQVNAVTPQLFRVLPSPQALAAAPLATIEALIRPTGFFRQKARHLKACARRLLEQHNGKVPARLEPLLQLPGVGRKTANVVLGAAYGVPGMVVDTHVARLSQRLGLSREGDPAKIELDLMAIIPRREWNDFAMRLIFYGREVCRAQKPLCAMCPLYDLCGYPAKEHDADLASSAKV